MAHQTIPHHPDIGPGASEVDAKLPHIAFSLLGLSILMTAVVVPVFALLLPDMFIPKLSRIWQAALMVNVVTAGGALWAWRRRVPVITAHPPCGARCTWFAPSLAGSHGRWARRS